MVVEVCPGGEEGKVGFSSVIRMQYSTLPIALKILSDSFSPLPDFHLLLLLLRERFSTLMSPTASSIESQRRGTVDRFDFSPAVSIRLEGLRIILLGVEGDCLP